MRGEDHWNQVYRRTRPGEVSWFQAEPAVSLALIEAAGVSPDAPVVDVGAGASLLVDRLLGRGFRDLTVIDIAAAPLSQVRERLGPRAPQVALVHADITTYRPERRFALWHDRAVFHFLTAPEDRRAYMGTLAAALRPEGHVIIATFGLDGPTRCSGLDVVRYDAAQLGAELGPGFRLKRAVPEEHRTPAGRVQQFQYCWFSAVA